MDGANECVRCGDKYEPYEVFIREDFNDIVAHTRVNEKWNLHEGDNDGFCKPCRMAVTDYGAYLTETEREELELKTEVAT